MIPSAQDWQDRGRLIPVGRHHGRHRLFCIDTGGDKPPLVVLHGYPTSSYDYARALPLLAEKHRVIVHDHLGFGFSDKPREYSYSLIEQADMALDLWRELGVTRADVLAHDYGTSVATEILARRERASLALDMRSLTLSNGSMHIEMARLRVIQRLLRRPKIGPVVARLGTEALFQRNIRRLFADRSFLDDSEISAMWQQLQAGGGRATLASVSRYLDERHKYWHRWIGALQTTDLPINIVWARRDPVAVEAMAHTLHGEIKNSRLHLLDDVGHFPMIEAAEAWTGAVVRLISSVTGG